MNNYLFCRGELSCYIGNRKITMNAEIDSQTSNYLLNINENDYMDYLYEKYVITTLILHDELMSIVEQKEKDIDISHDYNRIIFNRNKPFYVKSLSITIGIPFDGDKELFYLIPSTSSSLFPVGIIEGNDLLLTYGGDKLTDKIIKDRLDHDIKLIKDYIGWVNLDIKPFNDNLKTYLYDILKKRKSKCFLQYVNTTFCKEISSTLFSNFKILLLNV